MVIAGAATATTTATPRSRRHGRQRPGRDRRQVREPVQPEAGRDDDGNPAVETGRVVSAQGGPGGKCASLFNLKLAATTISYAAQVTPACTATASSPAAATHPRRGQPSVP